MEKQENFISEGHRSTFYIKVPFGIGHPPPTHQMQSTCVREGSRVPNLQTEFNYLDSFKSYGCFSDFVVPVVPTSSPHHRRHPHVILIALRRSPCGPHGLWSLWSPHVIPVVPTSSPSSPRHPHIVPVIPTSSPSSPHCPHSPQKVPMWSPWSVVSVVSVVPMSSPCHPRHPHIIPTSSRRSPHHPQPLRYTPHPPPPPWGVGAPNQ